MIEVKNQKVELVMAEIGLNGQSYDRKLIKFLCVKVPSFLVKETGNDEVKFWVKNKNLECPRCGDISRNNDDFLFITEYMDKNTSFWWENGQKFMGIAPISVGKLTKKFQEKFPGWSKLHWVKFWLFSYCCNSKTRGKSTGLNPHILLLISLHFPWIY